QAVAGQMEIQIVALPQSGVVREPGMADLLAAALSAGADLIGGVDPEGFDHDVNGQLDILFDLAEATGKGLDIHLHDGGESGACQIDQIVERTLALGLSGKVAISHGFCLGQVGASRLAGLADGLARAGIAIISHGGAAATPPPFRRLYEAGVVVAAGSDNIRDGWSPFGNGDMVERAMLLAWRSGFRRDEDIAFALDMATGLAVRALGMTDYGLRPGCRADLVTLPGETLAEAVVSRRARGVIVRHGGLHQTRPDSIR
ncbi:MAG: amidohydrolase family protein, partial [Alphaproteobacteria bacterium]